MKVEDCYQLGYVIKTHGLKGEVQLMLDVDDPSAYQELESVLILQGGALVPFFLEYIQVSGKKALAKFEETESIEEASPMVSCELFLPLEILPELPAGDYYYHQLIGLDLYNDDQLLGKVDQVYEIPPQNLISLIYNGVEVMIPINDEIIKRVDIKEGKIEAQLPEGLLEVYLEDNEN
ncbi:ribosome maturation factor RimM [Reichenbachiella versicolor]|uniref:ribosome maturation factor RimM n=1 Tax=Reichenbachiella versicolor TaxID=1821036 RepID=UPI000D6E78E9|nr:ribosome maturation factor RimM [Reichenbachiella versicolor]